MEGKKIKNKAIALVMAMSMVFQTVAPAVVYAQEDDSISETIMSETLSEDKKFSGTLGLRFEDIEGYFFEDVDYENMTLEELVKFIKDKGKENKTPIITHIEYRKDNGNKIRDGLALDEELLESGVRISVYYAKPYLNYVNSELYNPDKESFYDVDFDFSRFGYNTKIIYDDTLPLGTRVTDQEGKRYINKFTADVIYGDKDYSNIKNHEQQDEQDEIIRVGTKNLDSENEEGFNIVLNDDLTANVSASAVQDDNKKPSKIVIRSNPKYVRHLSVNKKSLPSQVEDTEEHWNTGTSTLFLKDDNNDRSFSFDFTYNEIKSELYNGLKIPFVVEMYAKDGSILSRSNTVYKTIEFEKPEHKTSIRKLKSWSDAQIHEFVTGGSDDGSSFVEAGIADADNKYLTDVFPVEVIVSNIAHKKINWRKEHNELTGTYGDSTYGKIKDTDERGFKKVEKRVYIPKYTAYNAEDKTTEEKMAKFMPDISGDWKLSDDGSYVYKFDERGSDEYDLNNIFSKGEITYREDKSHNLQATDFPHFTFENAVLNKNIDVESEVIRTFNVDGGESDDPVRESKDTVSFVITADEKRGGHILTDIRDPHYDNPNDDNGTAYFYNYYSKDYKKERNGEFKWTMSAHNKKNSGTDFEHIYSVLFKDDKLDERMKFVGLGYEDKRGRLTYKVFGDNNKVLQEGKLESGVRVDIPEDIQEQVKRIEVFADGVDIKKGDAGFFINIYTRLKNPEEDFGDNRNFINEGYFEFVYAQLDEIKGKHEQNFEEFIKKIFSGRDKDNIVMKEVNKKTGIFVSPVPDVYIDEDYEGKNHQFMYFGMEYNMPEFINGKNLVYTALLPKNTTLLDYDVNPDYDYMNNADAILKNLQSKVIEDYNGTGRTAIVVTADEFNFVKSSVRGYFSLIDVRYKPNIKKLGEKLTADGYMSFDNIENFDDIFVGEERVVFNGKETAHMSKSGVVKRKPGIYGTNLVREKGKDEWQKSIDSKYNPSKTYQYRIAEENFSKTDISDFEIINIFPYKGDKYLIDNSKSRGSNMTPYITGVDIKSDKIGYKLLQISEEEINEYYKNGSYDELSNHEGWTSDIPQNQDGKVILMKMYSKEGRVIKPDEVVEAVVNIQIPALNSLITSGLLLTNTFVRKDSSTGGEWIESDKSELNIKFDINGMFKKVDSKNNKNLTGVEFELRNGDKVIDTLTSDNNGNVFFTFDYEDYNDLTIVETKPLEGYKPLDNVIKISDYDIENMKLDIGTVKNDPDITLYNVKVNKKVDMGNIKNISDYLDFRLTYENGVGVSDKTVYLKDKNGNTLEELITDSNGYVISENKYSSVKGYYFEVNGGKRYDVNFNGYGVVSDLGDIDELKDLYDKDIVYRKSLIGDMSFEEFVNQSLTDENVMKYYYFMKPFKFEYYYDGKLVETFEINMKDGYVIEDVEDVSKVKIKEVDNDLFTPSYSEIKEVDGLYNIEVVNKLNNKERNMTEGVVKFIPNTGITSFK